jgi:hypothetical protein
MRGYFLDVPGGGAQQHQNLIDMGKYMRHITLN